MKSIRTGHLEGKNWCQEEMHKFLRQYRSTPHPSTTFAPFQLLSSQSPRTKFPKIPNKLDHESAVSTQAKLKQHADHQKKAKKRDFKVGDKVVVKSEKGNKFTTPYQPEPHVIQAKKASILTAASKDRVVTRNSSFFKKLPHSTHHKQ